MQKTGQEAPKAPQAKKRHAADVLYYSAGALFGWLAHAGSGCVWM